VIIEAPAYLETMTERQFQDLIIETAVLNGWLVYHTYDSRRSQPGFPDLVLLKPPRLAFWEVKTAKGRLRLEQAHWLTMLKVAPTIDARLVRPKDWDWIARYVGGEE